VYIGRDPVTARKRYVARTVRGGKRDAQRALAALAHEVNEKSVTRSRATVGDLLEAWFDHARDDLSPKTVRETRGYLDRNLIPGLGGVRLDHLRVDDVDRYYRRLRTTGGRSGRPLAPATIRRIHGILRRALSQGVRWGWVASNVAASASPPRVPVSTIKPPATEEIAALFAIASKDDPAFACYLLLAAATGARRSELIALRWSDVDLAGGVVRIARAIVFGVVGLVEKGTKNHSVRTVALDPLTVGELAAHGARAKDLAAAVGQPWSVDRLVFSSAPDGMTPWFPDSVTRAFGRVCRRAGLSGVRLHDLRHYVATQLLTSGVDVRTVAGRLGHRDAATTLNVYSHFIAQADHAAALLLGDAFAAAMETRSAV
jgi:integrase